MLSIIKARAQLLVVQSQLPAAHYNCVHADGYELEVAQNIRVKLWQQEADLLGVIGEAI